MIDWSATGSMIAGIGTSIGAGAVIYAAHKGADTFNEWRRQKHHERCISLAEEILTLTYKLKRAFEGIRSPAIFAGEMSEIAEKLRESGLIDREEEPDQLLTTAQAALSRTDFHRGLFDRLLDNIPVAKAIFGDQVADQMNVFWSLRVRITTAAHSYVRDRRSLPAGSDRQLRQQERRERNENILWAGGDENGIDQFEVDLVGAIAHLERFLLPILRGGNKT